jgi:hypothetical protein
MIVADFNGDGKPDLAVARDAGFSVLLGLGNGRFAAPSSITNYGWGYYLAAGDFNCDRNLDLVAAGSYGGSVLLGDGRGNFPVRTNSVASNYPYGLAIGDFNGDGRLDLATRGNYHTVEVEFGRGDGSFGIFTNYTLANEFSDIRAGDLNGNGRLDLVVALNDDTPFNSNTVCVLPNTGGGAFTTAQYYGGASGANEYQRSLELADLNHDGALDLALLNCIAGSVTIWLNNGAGAFGPPTDYPVGFSPLSIAAADFNGDGNMDLLVRGGTTAVILLGHGDGSFTVADPMSVPDDSGRRNTVAVGDFNGDGMPDIAFLDNSGGAVAVMLNQTPPILQLTPMPGYSQLAWLTTFGAGYTLECTTNLAVPGGWQPFPYPPVVIGNQKAVADWENGERKFYRLRKP